MTTPTTEPPRGSGVSVRVRITATVALLTTLALAGAGALVYLIERDRQDAENRDSVAQEFAEFRALQSQRDFSTVRGLIRAYLRSNVPSDQELFVGWWDDGPRLQSPESNGIADDAEFVATVRGLIATNGRASVDTPSGSADIDVQTITADGEEGALVVVTFVERTYEGLRETMRTYAIVAALSLLIVTAFAALQSGRLLAPLRVLRQTAEEIGDSDLSTRLPVRGNDDITALTRTVNGMLDRLEAAFVGQRRFLDDAGHELRTPLTVVRGHLELLDVGSPEEIAETKALLMDEVDRMTRLVGDLILLAKSDRPDFVALRPTDITGLTVDVLSKARALAPRRWTLDASASLRAAVDEQRLTQALLQLCDNAVKHTRPGDVVAVGSDYDDTHLRLWVRDTGPGVPASSRDVIFDRFGRAEVHDGDEGFGLGLSIVKAIVEAHGGTISVTDATPPGALFTLLLPLRPAAPDPHADPAQQQALDDGPDPAEELSIWHGS